MVIHFASLDHTPTLVAALELRFRAIVCDVLIHLVQDEADSAVEQASNLAVHAFIVQMFL